MAVVVRAAVPSDVEAVAGLSIDYRRRLEAWGSPWWRRAAGADDLHGLWLAHLVGAEGPVFRVVADEDGTVIGGAVANPQPGQWFVDDLAVADERWSDAGAALLAAVAERPALTCVAVADGARAEAVAAAGLSRASRYWIGPPAATGPARGLERLAPGRSVPPGAPHTFGGSLDPHAPGVIALTDGAGGLAVAASSITAPPVYDPGGTVCVVDRLTGDRPRMLDAVLATCADRGDVLVAVVARPDDEPLGALLADRGLTPLVDAYAWPSGA